MKHTDSCIADMPLHRGCICGAALLDMGPIHVGDCIEVMRRMPAGFIDAIVTDPPAAVSFMGKKWDHDKGGRTQWVAWMTEVMVECHRLLKPGGYAVVWSLPRTCHWTAWAMEDAGFIIRDQLAHVFASGFPKGKAQLKPAREDWWLARKPGPLRSLAIDECRIGAGDHVPGGGTFGGVFGNGKPANHDGHNRGRWPSNLLLSDPELFDEPNPWVVGSGATQQSPADYNRSVDADGGVTRWNSEGEGSLVPGYGDSGGYSRFFIIPKADRADREPVLRGQLPATNAQRAESGHATWCERCGLDRVNVTSKSACSCDEPQWSRVPKTARVNKHPTVKPVSLMRHLVRLVTPPGGIVLDCFAGSGSTLIAAELEGFKWIGIEKEPEYVAIAEARLNGTQRGLGLDVGAPTKRQAKANLYSGERHPGNWPWRDHGPEEPAA